MCLVEEVIKTCVAHYCEGSYLRRYFGDFFCIQYNCIKCDSTERNMQKNLARQKIREENILSMKVRAKDIDLIDAERFDSFSSVVFNCKNEYYCFYKKLNNIRPTLKKLQSSLCDYKSTRNKKIVM